MSASKGNPRRVKLSSVTSDLLDGPWFPVQGDPPKVRAKKSLGEKLSESVLAAVENRLSSSRAWIKTSCGYRLETEAAYLEYDTETRGLEIVVQLQAPTSVGFDVAASTSLRGFNRILGIAYRDVLLDYAHQKRARITEYEDRNGVMELEFKFTEGSSVAREPMDYLLQTLIEPEREVGEGTLIRALRIPLLEISRQIERDADFLFEFSKQPRKFEELIAASYARLGYEVTLTPQSGDLGVDVFVDAILPGLGRIRHVDQMKAYSAGRVVTPNDVRALAGVLYRDSSIHRGLITTTSTFAPSVFEEWKDLIPDRLELRDGEALKAWLKEIDQ